MASESESECRCPKDKIDQWIKDGVDLVSLIDQGELRNVSDVRQYLACYGDSACVDRRNIFGQTPLIIACRNRQKDIVNLLLEAGANPNVRCNIGNSAIHLACQGDKDVITMCREKPNYPQEKLEEIIKIVEILASHGATLQMNENGHSPVSVAALNSFKDVVVFFASSNVISVPLDEKVKAYKLLGVSQAIFDQHHAIDACESFHIAASLQSKDDENVTSHLISSDLDAWFYDMMNKENASENEVFAIKLKAFTIGLQCLPEEIRDEFDFCDAMGECAKAALFDGKAPQEGYEMLVALIKKEMIEEYELGTVMGMLKDALEPSIRAHESSVIKFILKLLETYSEEFRAGACSSELMCEKWEIVELLGGLMFNFAYCRSDSKDLKSSFPFVVSIINCIKKMTAEEPNSNADYGKVSITAVFMDKLAHAMWDDVYCGQSKKTRNRVKFALCGLLHYTGFDPDTDWCLLGTFLQVVRVAYDMEFILSVTRVLLRYGCPPEDISLEDLDEDDPEVKELLALICPPTTPIPLEELAARVILQNAIPYRGRLPDILCEKIEGEMLSADPSELDFSSDSDGD